MMVLCTLNNQHSVFIIDYTDVFCRAVGFTSLPLNKGRVRPKSKEL